MLGSTRGATSVRVSMPSDATVAFVLKPIQTNSTS